VVPSGLAQQCLVEYERNRHGLLLFMNAVRDFFALHPQLSGEEAIVHSVKARLKAPDHLLEKVARKVAGGEPVDPAKLLWQVTDLAGVRVLHLYHDQFPMIHRAVKAQVEAQEWTFHEEPRAYTWDPEQESFFDGLGLLTEVRDTFYTSVHYVVRPRAGSPYCCEIQVRTLFEEVWGEIDHRLNYPRKTESVPCAEQLRVLSKLVGAGSRLADAIFRSHAAWSSSRKN
jgi:GTP pyrophosphokinase